MKHLGRYIFKKILMPSSLPSTVDINWSAVWYWGSQVMLSNQAERLRTSVLEFFIIICSNVVFLKVGEPSSAFNYTFTLYSKPEVLKVYRGTRITRRVCWVPPRKV